MDAQHLRVVWPILFLLIVAVGGVAARKISRKTNNTPNAPDIAITLSWG
jgi:hypothetical protein